MMVLGLAVATTCSLAADAEVVDGYRWAFRPAGNGVEINGEATSLLTRCAVFPKPRNSVSVPSVLGGRPLTCIGELAFLNCRDLLDVTIPNGVKRIGTNAFRNCEKLVRASIPDGLDDIGNWAFGDCTALADIKIPSSVTNIGEGAFHRCGSLTGITIPNGVKHIGWNGFSECKSLTGVAIPGSVTVLADEAFYRCESLTYAKIESGVTSIGRMAFRGCRGLTEMIIPASVTNVGECAFRDCPNLRSVTFLGREARVADNAFDSHVVAHALQKFTQRQAAARDIVLLLMLTLGCFLMVDMLFRRSHRERIARGLYRLSKMQGRKAATYDAMKRKSTP